MTILEAALRDAAVTREVVVGPGAAAAVPAVAARVAPGARWLVVADRKTWEAAGRDVHEALQAQGQGTASPLLFDAEPRLKPRAEAAQLVAARLAQTGATPVAVGSGVVNDLVKYAAAIAGRPYVCVATAASMDGYAASGAALLEGGFKRTLACPPPVAILADPAVLASAPARMVGWGYGDLAGKVVAGADWVLADALGVEAINRGPFDLVQDHLPEWLGRPERLAAADPQALAALLAGLLVSGFAMQAHGNSRPASGSDHQFSHLWEMEGLQVDGEAAAHGACVGVGCVAMLALYEWLLARTAQELESAHAPDYDDAAALDREITAALGDGEVAAAARTEMTAKRAIGSRSARVQRFMSAWPGLRQSLASRLVPAREMQRRLATLGAPTHPHDLGLDVATLAADYRRARLIRRRYTLLDLLEDLGWLDRAVGELCGPQGFWTVQPPTWRHTPAISSNLAQGDRP
ncbi:iron-containing alcohol dehydrogenase [Ramlibacter albus]|uniref:Iron-containing alcohol dehydrogenase n=1 Tax=Ramlibacter albus TaxID=2079448 RepID=A0A923MFU2_9BURK|nr:iron-containing alcohol dehydrogenase [Ramlibacter albus]MBC5768479.1 iron-containing alcohol dehydrogenase [Ramlibacter albus]